LHRNNLLTVVAFLPRPCHNATAVRWADCEWTVVGGRWYWQTVAMKGVCATHKRTPRCYVCSSLCQSHTLNRTSKTTSRFDQHYVLNSDASIVESTVIIIQLSLPTYFISIVNIDEAQSVVCPSCKPWDAWTGVTVNYGCITDVHQKLYDSSDISCTINIAAKEC